MFTDSMVLSWCPVNTSAKQFLRRLTASRRKLSLPPGAPDDSTPIFPISPRRASRSRVAMPPPETRHPGPTWGPLGAVGGACETAKLGFPRRIQRIQSSSHPVIQSGVGSSGASSAQESISAVSENPPMRINLTTPFSERDQVKALGARWDAAKKLWYIQDVADLEPFQRWMPKGTPKETVPSKQAGSDTGPAGVADCGCDVLPWDDCVHTTTT